MYSVTFEEMLQIENKAFCGGAKPNCLIEQVGLHIADILHSQNLDKKIVGYVGKGHNGADALVALRILKQRGWRVELRCAYPIQDLSPITQEKYRDLLHLGISPNQQASSLKTGILLDGLLGIGAQGELRNPVLSLAKEINHLAQSRCFKTVSIDIPTGVDTDTGASSANSVVADRTLCVAIPKQGLLEHRAVNHVGSIDLIELDELQPPASGNLAMIQAELPKRPFDYHKGMAGSVGIWAGSKGMLGAAILCSEAALRAGAGLVTLYSDEENYPLLASKAIAPIMVKPLKSLSEIVHSEHDAYIVGPGLGQNVEPSTLWELMKKKSVPTVLDADALNLIAKYAKHHFIAENHILTPHPGEMRKLFPSSRQLERKTIVERFCSQQDGVLLYKGARTIVSKRNSPLWVNPTGGPGMATAGQGDVLAGVIGGFCAQGILPLEAAKMAAYYCGKASTESNISPYTLTAIDTLAELCNCLT